ncbi:polysaccharide deacetylase family protein [Alteriqipengyuania flavescens]|uniref:polysaccharide deacetylase family protein n=1 Tax=Alteriqipengyuania flavescens TaxID=3053610 RepID=UPI0025B5D3F3|nr:polysaccharide deacetylase family protein [Alteriqipengyuania flavescens]WJY18642.1 polysaccharide deacetylase family protein [Alteriqipengyuania flavescens]WJY24582.1 polysaccharide deacetylase family protein [Alteriqipengyuania flavescens]
MQPLVDPPPPGSEARFAHGFGPRFILTVDTEEEFDWSQPLRSEGHSLRHVPRLARFQQFCEGEQVRPIYLVDHPVATSVEATAILRDAVRAGRADIGVQLHPWVSPPFEEEVSEYNSFAGNLPRELEQEKLSRLRDAIAEAYGTDPLIYRAGRYGIGPNTAALLVEEGIAIDTSVRPLFGYSGAGGPAYHDHPLVPYWADSEQRLLELPLTTVFSGMFRKQGRAIYPRLWRWPELRGILARLGLLERLPLTPEGVPLADALSAIDIALDDGLPLLNFSFHSPSLEPGHTPYVRTERDLDALYDWWRGVLDHLRMRQVRDASVREVMEAVIRQPG